MSISYRSQLQTNDTLKNTEEDVPLIATHLLSTLHDEPYLYFLSLKIFFFFFYNEKLNKYTKKKFRELAKQQHID